MKLIVLIVLIIGSKTSFASSPSTKIKNNIVKNCQEYLKAKNNICTSVSHAFQKGNNSFELAHSLIDLLDEKSYEYEISEVFDNINVSNCRSQGNSQRTVACINLKEIKSKKSENVSSYVEDLF